MSEEKKWGDPCPRCGHKSEEGREVAHVSVADDNGHPVVVCCMICYREYERERRKPHIIEGWKA